MKKLLTILSVLFCFAAAAQDTTDYTYHTTHDTLERQPIPEKINHIGDSIVVIFDTSYNAYSIYQTYWNVDGSITVTIPLYDTVPAHDSVFICTGCASHDTTVRTISNHLVTISANNQNKALGATFTFTQNGTQVSVTGGSLKAGDVITYDNSSSTGASSGATSGTYAIALSAVTIMRGATDVTSTYNITYLNGTLTVAGAIPITITADNQGKTQGQTFTFLHNGSQVSVTSGTLNSGDVITVDNAASSGSGSGAAAGSYAITLSSVTIKNGATDVTFKYNITYQTGTLTVAAAPLVITVKAKDQTKQYGSTFTFTHTGGQVQVVSGGLASGDVITVDNAASSGSGSSAAVGSYSITLSSITIKNGATDVTGNYTITYQTGTLTVTTIPITVKANNQSKVQGNAFTFTHNGSQVSVVSGALLSGNTITVDNAASTGSGAGVPTGSYAITLSSVTITSGATNVTANYSITYQGGTLSVSAGAAPMIYGMFPNTGGTLASRITLTKNSGNNAFRYNINVGSTWQVDAVHAAGLKALMTYNEPRCCNAEFFPAGAALAPALTRLTNYLNANPNDLPELISFNNEEPNFGYWQGTAADYVNWIKQATIIAHNHGIPVSNGGLLHNIFWYVRYIYQQEGKTDSVAMINAAEGIGPSTPAFAQVVIDWYTVEIPGLIAANVDYLNFHFYTPKDKDDAITIPTGTLAIILKFLGRYGKPIVTTETGTNNHNQTLFNAHMDIIKNAGVKIMTYYLGTGPLSEENLPFWTAWILQ